MTSYLRGLLFLSILLTARVLYAQSLTEIIEGAPNQEAFWAVTVRSTDGSMLESYNSEKLIIPASNQKLYTTAAVLDGLGSSYRYTTQLYRTGEIVDSVLYGNVIIRGVGDPSISGTFYEDDRLYVFKEWAAQLRQEGIKEISGSLIANIGYFTAQVFPKGWDWADLSFYYGVEIAPLSFNNNAVDLVVDASGNTGSTPDISWFPFNTDYVEFFNSQKITSPGTKYDEEYIKYLGENKIHLGSSLPQGYLEEESLAISGAHDFFLDSFDHYLNIAGIKTSGNFETQRMDIPDYWYTYPIIGTHRSEPLSKLIEWTNKESDNFYAEMLLRTLTAEKVGTPADFETGIVQVRNFLGSMGLDTTYVMMKDGAGMASGNFTTTGVLSEFLVMMLEHQEFESFYNSLSIAGIDGTLAHRMKRTALYKNMVGKSGYVGGVRTLSGYLKTKSGNTIAVSLAANHFIGKVKPIDQVHEQILLYLYEKY